MARVDPGLIWQGKEPLDALEEGFQAPTGEIHPADALREEGVSGEQVIVDPQAYSARSVARGVDNQTSQVACG